MLPDLGPTAGRLAFGFFVMSLVFGSAMDFASWRDDEG